MSVNNLYTACTLCTNFVHSARTLPCVWWVCKYDAYVFGSNNSRDRHNQKQESTHPYTLRYILCAPPCFASSRRPSRQLICMLICMVGISTAEYVNIVRNAAINILVLHRHAPKIRTVAGEMLWSSFLIVGARPLPPPLKVHHAPCEKVQRIDCAPPVSRP